MNANIDITMADVISQIIVLRMCMHNRLVLKRTFFGKIHFLAPVLGLFQNIIYNGHCELEGF